MKKREVKSTAKMVEQFIKRNDYAMDVTVLNYHVVISSKDTDGLYIPNRLMNFLVSVAVCGLFFVNNDAGKTEVWI